VPSAVEVIFCELAGAPLVRKLFVLFSLVISRSFYLAAILTLECTAVAISLSIVGRFTSQVLRVSTHLETLAGSRQVVFLRNCLHARL